MAVRVMAVIGIDTLCADYNEKKRGAVSQYCGSGLLNVRLCMNKDMG